MHSRLSRPTECRVCGAALRSRYPAVTDPYSGELFSIDACRECGLGHTQPQPHELGRYYGPVYYGDRHGATASLCLARRLRRVASVCGGAPGRRLLDVGCGDGSFLRAAQRRGWALSGTELDPAKAREAGLDVHATVQEAAASGPFDCITSWHTLEHFRDPLAEVRGWVRALAPGGAILVAVPDADGVQARAFGRHWFHLDVPRHLFHFGRRSLTALLQRAELRPVRTWHQELEYDAFGWSQSLLNRMFHEPNQLFHALTGKTTLAGQRGKGLAANRALGVALTGAAVPMTVATSWLGRGGTLVMAARRTSQGSQE